jgi:hypothetical protein
MTEQRAAERAEAYRRAAEQLARSQELILTAEQMMVEAAERVEQSRQVRAALARRLGDPS